MSGGAGARRYDAVVVGAGIAGLSAACFLARSGRRVALLEAAADAGGLCRTVRAGGLSWDLALYSLRGCGPGGPFAGLLEELGLAGRLAFRHAAAAYLVRIDREEFPVTTARAEMLEAADRLEPRGADRLGPFLDRVAATNPVRDYGTLSRRTFAEAAAAAGVGGRLLAALAAPLMVSLGLPPERASAYFAFLKYRLLLSGGVSRPEGGAAVLVSALQDRYTSSGGELFFGERVEAVSLEPDGAKRVSAAHRAFLADALVLAVDAATALSWLGPALPGRLRAKPALLTPALSAELLFCAAPPAALPVLGLDRAPQVIEVRDPDLLGLHRRLRTGDGGAAEGIVGLTSPAAWGPAIPAAAMIPLSAFFLAPPREGGADPGAGELLPRLRRAVPQLPAETEARAAFGPRGLAGLSGGGAGSFCGWEMGPERYGGARIPPRLPVPGVCLAGHWTDPGPSILNAALSGRAAALALLASG